MDRRLISLVDLARSPPHALPLLFVLGLMSALAEGVSIGLFIPLLDTLLGGGASVPSGPLASLMQAIVRTDDPLLRLLAIGGAILALMTFRTAIAIAQVRYATGLAGRINRGLRIAAGRQLLEVGYSFFMRSNQGRLLAILDTHSYRTADALLILGLAVVQACTVLIGMLLLMTLSWQLTLLVLVFLVPALLVVRLVSRAAHAAGVRLVAAYTQMSERNLELLSAMRTIRVFNQEQGQAKRVEAAAEALYRSYWRTESLTQGIPAIAELLYLPAFLVVVGYAWYAHIGLPSLLVFLLLLYRIQPSLKRLDQARVMIDSLLPSVVEVLDLLRRDDKPYLAPGAQPFAGLRDRIEFDRVTFGYGTDAAPAIDGVSFTIRKGETFALIGPSGSGKSTLINLLFRLYDPAAGAIRVDGVALTGLELRSWRQHLAFAGQDADLIAGTIRENLTFGRADLDAARIADALAIASAGEFVARLPQGLDTEVGPHGTRLSGGQRQRIALARAILHRPDLLVLDEATSAVDSVTELEIKSAIARMPTRPTIVIITHRLETLRIADRAIAIVDGRVMAEGTPDDVIARIDVERALAQRPDRVDETVAPAAGMP